MDITEELPTVLSLCSGYAGAERGLELAGFEHRTVAFVEIEAYAIANLANKMEAGELLPAPIWSNLKTLPVEPFRDRVDLLTGGYPCQPFSAAGKRKGEEDPRHLWPHIREIVRAVRPVRCFFENVEGHITLGLREVISDLESLGYKTAWGIFSAREVGAPHQRKRVYILADSNNRQREYKDEEIRAGWDAAVDGGKHLADTGSEGSQGSQWVWQAGEKRLSEGHASQCIGELADSNGVRCDGGELSDRTGERSVEIEALQRPQQSLVRREVERCSGDSGENELADSDCCRGRENQQQAEFRTIRTEQSPGSSRTEVEPREAEQVQRWPSRPGTTQHGWESPRTIKRGLGGTSNGSTNRVDRLRLLGNGIVPQTAAKAWITLNNQISTEGINHERS